jgi:predicted MarR family transcription regulator
MSDPAVLISLMQNELVHQKERIQEQEARIQELERKMELLVGPMNHAGNLQ